MGDDVIGRGRGGVPIRGPYGFVTEELPSALGALGQMLYGGARGAATATLGAPGELERLVRMGRGASLEATGANAQPAGSGITLGGMTLPPQERNVVGAALKAGEGDTTLPNMRDISGYLERAGLKPSGTPQEDILRNVPMTPGQAARLTRPVLGGIGRLAAEGIRRGVEEGRGPLSALRASAAPMYAVRTKGGNFDPVRTEAYLAANLGVEGPQGFAGFIPEGRELTPQANTWAQKQLYNYLTKDLGSTTDPLLAVEKEGRGMHIPADMMTNPEWLESRTAAWRSGRPMVKEERAIFDKHYGLTQEPLTPWGELSSSNVYTQPAKDYLQGSDIRDLKHFASWPDQGISKPLVDPADSTFESLLTNPDNKHLKPFAWYEKNPEAQVHSLIDPHEDPFGFSHVMDYLNAAQKPHGRSQVFGKVEGKPDYMSMLRQNHPDLPLLPFRRADIDMDRALVNAGLDIHPDDLGRLSVADAVRKTRDYNAMLGENASLGAPDLARGHVPFKEYPEQGMKWVQFKPGEMEKVAPTTDAEALSHYNDRPKGPWPWGGRSEAKFEDLQYKEPDLTSPGYLVDPESGEVMGRGSTEDLARKDALSKVRNSLDNHRMRKARESASEELAAGLNAEGKHMGHCVGGYCDEVADRGTQIYSLRDKNGNPHVTVEVRPHKTLDQAFAEEDTGWRSDYDETISRLERELKQRKVFRLGQSGTPFRSNATREELPGTSDLGLANDTHRNLYDLWTEQTGKLGDHDKAMQWLNQVAPDLHAKYNTPQAPDIVQIKGKGNAAPVDRYKPFVQDFVKSGQWGRVGDLHNTGLKQHKGGYHTDEDLWKMMDEHPRFQKIKEYHAINRYPEGSAGHMMINRDSNSDPAKLLNLLDDERFNLTDSGRDARPDYASGGSVDEDDVMPQFASHMNIEEPQPRFASLLNLKG